jgi:hypothetical protein
VARKTIRVSGQSGQEIPDGEGVRELDLTDAEADRLGGRAVAVVVAG